jgi:hypothetical protein
MASLRSAVMRRNALAIEHSRLPCSRRQRRFRRAFVWATANAVCAPRADPMLVQDAQVVKAQHVALAGRALQQPQQLRHVPLQPTLAVKHHGREAHLGVGKVPLRRLFKVQASLVRVPLNTCAGAASPVHTHKHGQLR